MPFWIVEYNTLAHDGERSGGRILHCRTPQAAYRKYTEVRNEKHTEFVGISFLGVVPAFWHHEDHRLGWDDMAQYL